MFAAGVINFLRGSVLIRIDGYFTERFINLCMNGDILLWDIKRAGETRLFARIRPSDFKRVKKAASKTRSKISIVKKSGIPFIMFRYRKRKFVFIGILLAVIMLWYFKSHVTGIDITGNERLESSVIESALKDFGIYKGAEVKDINRKLVQNKMMTRLDDIAWIGINIRGSRVYIEVKERLDTKEETDKSIPCDLIALKDGIIEELDVRQGQSMVKKKQFVQAGDLLVSGAVDSQVSGIRYVHSFGEIFALTELEKEEEYKLEIIEKKPTGRTKKKHSICFGNKRIGLFLKKEPDYKNYEMKTEKKDLGIFDISVETEVYTEQEHKKIKRSEKETFEAGKNDLCEKMKKQIKDSAEIKNISAKYYKKDSETLVVTVNFELRENIAKERTIDKIENLNYDILDMDNNN